MHPLLLPQERQGAFWVSDSGFIFWTYTLQAHCPTLVQCPPLAKAPSSAKPGGSTTGHTGSHANLAQFRTSTALISLNKEGV